MNRFSSILRVCIPILAFIFILMELIVANQLTLLARDVGNLEKSIANIEDENDMLSQEVASASALTTISQKAQLLGFRKSLASDYMTIGIESVALGMSPRLEPALFAGNSGVPQ